MSESERIFKSSRRLPLLSFILLFALILVGCGDDGVSDIAFDCTNCEYWTKISDDLASFPAYYPDSDDERKTIAFSSDRGNSSNIENVWILVRGGIGEEDQYYQITDAPEDEFDPAWNPAGTKIAYTRSAEGRFDIFLKDVSDFSNPGDEVRITSETPIPNDTLNLPFRPSGAIWIDDDEILFSNSVDIFIVTIDDADTPVDLRKMIDDPSDYVLSNVSDFIENQATGIRGQGGVGDQIYFVSDSRVALGSIRVVASNIDVVGGEEVIAEIFLEGVASNVESPNVVGGRPVGTYVVGARVTDFDATETFCDTMMTDVINVFENDTAAVDFEFSNNRGAISLITPSLNSFVHFDGNLLSAIDQDTTTYDCVYPNVDHVIKIESIMIVTWDSLSQQLVGLMDSACIQVDNRETVEVRLNVDHPDSVGLADAGCSDYRREFPENELAKNLHVQQGEPILWHYDGESGNYTALVGGHDIYPSYPSISPDGTKLAMIVNFELLGVIDVVTGEAWEIRLPGESGINICLREIAFPTWSPDGERIVVSLSPCTDRPSTDHNATEYNVWEVDWEKARLPR